MVEAGGETTSEEKEKIVLEEEEEEVIQMLLVEERIRIQVSQVARGLINKKIQPHYCNKFGHHAYVCKKKQYDQGRKITNQSTNTSTLTSAMLMASTSPIECNVVQESPHDMVLRFKMQQSYD